MKITKEKFLEIFDEHFNKVDEELNAILKGHLLIERALNQIIEDFVFHSDKLIEADLSFFKKVHVARSMSLDQSDNSMWALILSFNSLRNDFVHELSSSKRQARIEKVKTLYVLEMKGDDFEKVWDSDPVLGIAYSTSLIVGFLITFHEEVLRFKSMVLEMDKLVNKRKD